MGLNQRSTNQKDLQHCPKKDLRGENKGVSMTEVPHGGFVTFALVSAAYFLGRCCKSFWWVPRRFSPISQILSKE
jgi:hypothetical protein